MTSITIKARCTNKNLTAGSDIVSASFLIVESSVASLTAGSLSFSYALADDTFTIGGYYDLTMVDGSAPAVKTGQRT
jgi:hypothetical protein